MYRINSWMHKQSPTPTMVQGKGGGEVDETPLGFLLLEYFQKDSTLSRKSVNTILKATKND